MDQLGDEWSRNRGMGGRITLAEEPHYVNIKEITPTINKNWLVALCGSFGLSFVQQAIWILIFGYEWLKGLLWLFIALGCGLILLGVGIEYFLIVRKTKDMERKSIRFSYRSSGLHLESSETGDTGPYGDSGVIS